MNYFPFHFLYYLFHFYITIVLITIIVINILEVPFDMVDAGPKAEMVRIFDAFSLLSEPCDGMAVSGS